MSPAEPAKTPEDKAKNVARKAEDAERKREKAQRRAEKARNTHRVKAARGRGEQTIGTAPPSAEHRLAEQVAGMEKRLGDLDGRMREVQRSAERLARDLRNDVIAPVRESRQALAALLAAEHLDFAQIPYPERLTAQRFRGLSQNEEDGITLALLKAAGPGPRVCVEVGCGTNGGCTGFLVDELGFCSLMLDAHGPNVEAVRRRFNPELLTADQVWITRESIDEVLRRNGFEGEIDVLSIDIDGNDLWVWEAVRAVDPRIVIVEYNSIFGPERSVAVPYDPEFHRGSLPRTQGLYYGASLAALARIGERRGYRLATTDHRGVNAFFVRHDVAPDVPGVTARRAFRLMDKHHRLLERGLSLDEIIEEQDLPLIEIG